MAYYFGTVERHKGDDIPFSLTPQGAAEDVRDWTMEATLTPTNGEGNAITIANGNISKTINGAISFTLPDTDTDALPDSTTLRVRVKRTDAGLEDTKAWGYLVLLP